MQSEFKPFAEAMTILAEALDVQLSAKRMEIYWRVLAQYSWSAVERALTTALGRKWFKFPQPGELIELIEGTHADHTAQAEQAWRQLWHAITSAGTYRSLFCEDRVLAETVRQLFGDWPSVGLMPRPESEDGPMYQVRHKEFLTTYTRLMGRWETYEPYLIGRTEAENDLKALVAYGQGQSVTHLPRQGAPEVVELRALMPDHPLVALMEAQERKALNAAQESDDA